MSTPNAAAKVQLSHEEYQRQIIDLAHILHWRVLHVRKSIGGTKQGWRTTTSIVGWPDLWCYHAQHGFLAIEVKVKPDKPTPEQIEVLADLATAGATTMVAYPSDWDAVVTALRGQKPSASPR